MASPKGCDSLNRAHAVWMTTLSYIFLLGPLFADTVGADDGSLLIDCYRWDGGVTANNTRCPNSNACCGPTATCLSNRLCHNVGDGPNLFVRGPCAVRGWDPDCAQICQYDESTGIFPRVTICGDGSLCCNDNPQCCQDGKGIFLDEGGNIASSSATAATTSYPPVGGSGPERFTKTPFTSTTSTTSSSSDVSTSSSSTSERAPAAATTSPPTTEPTITPSSSSSSSSPDDSISLKVGLGLGIPLAILMTACVVYLVVRRRNRRDEAAATELFPQYPPSAPSHIYPPYSPRTMYSGTTKEYPIIPSHAAGRSPVEIQGQSAVELDASAYGMKDRYELR